MKKIFTNPRLTIIEIDEKDIVATSDPGSTMSYGGDDDGSEVSAQSRQRNSIWDD